MDAGDLKADLHGYLQNARDARNLPSDDRQWWAAHRDQVERAARDAEQASGRFA
jgi:hypothetical protein